MTTDTHTPTPIDHTVRVDGVAYPNLAAATQAARAVWYKTGHLPSIECPIHRMPNALKLARGE